VWLEGELRYLLSITYEGQDVADLEIDPQFEVEDIREGVPEALPPLKVVKALLHLLGTPFKEVKSVKVYNDIRKLLSEEDIEALQSELMLQLDLCMFDF
jgi:hypothetical protein